MSKSFPDACDSPVFLQQVRQRTADKREGASCGINLNQDRHDVRSSAWIQQGFESAVNYTEGLLGNLSCLSDGTGVCTGDSIAVTSWQDRLLHQNQKSREGIMMQSFALTDVSLGESSDDGSFNAEAGLETFDQDISCRGILEIPDQLDGLDLIGIPHDAVVGAGGGVNNRGTEDCSSINFEQIAGEAISLCQDICDSEPSSVDRNDESVGPSMLNSGFPGQEPDCPLSLTSNGGTSQLIQSQCQGKASKAENLPNKEPRPCNLPEDNEFSSVVPQLSEYKGKDLHSEDGLQTTGCISSGSDDLMLVGHSSELSFNRFAAELPEQRSIPETSNEIAEAEKWEHGSKQCAAQGDAANWNGGSLQHDAIPLSGSAHSDAQASNLTISVSHCSPSKPNAATAPENASGAVLNQGTTQLSLQSAMCSSDVQEMKNVMLEPSGGEGELQQSYQEKCSEDSEAVMPKPFPFVEHDSDEVPPVHILQLSPASGLPVDMHDFEEKRSAPDEVACPLPADHQSCWRSAEAEDRMPAAFGVLEPQQEKTGLSEPGNQSGLSLSALGCEHTVPDDSEKQFGDGCAHEGKEHFPGEGVGHNRGAESAQHDAATSLEGKTLKQPGCGNDHSRNGASQEPVDCVESPMGLTKTVTEIDGNVESIEENSGSVCLEPQIPQDQEHAIQERCLQFFPDESHCRDSEPKPDSNDSVPAHISCESGLKDGATNDENCLIQGDRLERSLDDVKASDIREVVGLDELMSGLSLSDSKCSRWEGPGVEEPPLAALHTVAAEQHGGGTSSSDSLQDQQQVSKDAGLKDFRGPCAESDTAPQHGSSAAGAQSGSSERGQPWMMGAHTNVFYDDDMRASVQVRTIDSALRAWKTPPAKFPSGGLNETDRKAIDAALKSSTAIDAEIKAQAQKDGFSGGVVALGSLDGTEGKTSDGKDGGYVASLVETANTPKQTSCAGGLVEVTLDIGQDATVSVDLRPFHQTIEPAAQQVYQSTIQRPGGHSVGPASERQTDSPRNTAIAEEDEMAEMLEQLSMFIETPPVPGACKEKRDPTPDREIMDAFLEKFAFVDDAAETTLGAAEADGGTQVDVKETDNWKGEVLHGLTQANVSSPPMEGATRKSETEDSPHNAAWRSPTPRLREQMPESGSKSEAKANLDGSEQQWGLQAMQECNERGLPAAQVPRAALSVLLSVAGDRVVLSYGERLSQQEDCTGQQQAPTAPVLDCATEEVDPNLKHEEDQPPDADQAKAAGSEECLSTQLLESEGFSIPSWWADALNMDASMVLTGVSMAVQNLSSSPIGDALDLESPLAGADCPKEEGLPRCGKDNVQLESIFEDAAALARSLEQSASRKPKKGGSSSKGKGHHDACTAAPPKEFSVGTLSPKAATRASKLRAPKGSFHFFEGKGKESNSGACVSSSVAPFATKSIEELFSAPTPARFRAGTAHRAPSPNIHVSFEAKPSARKGQRDRFLFGGGASCPAPIFNLEAECSVTASPTSWLFPVHPLAEAGSENGRAAEGVGEKLFSKLLSVADDDPREGELAGAAAPGEVPVWGRSGSKRASPEPELSAGKSCSLSSATGVFKTALSEGASAVHVASSSETFVTSSSRGCSRAFPLADQDAPLKSHRASTASSGTRTVRRIRRSAETSSSPSSAATASACLGAPNKASGEGKQEHTEDFGGKNLADSTRASHSASSSALDSNATIAAKAPLGQMASKLPTAPSIRSGGAPSSGTGVLYVQANDPASTSKGKGSKTAGEKKAVSSQGGSGSGFQRMLSMGVSRLKKPGTFGWSSNSRQAAPSPSSQTPRGPFSWRGTPSTPSGNSAQPPAHISVGAGKRRRRCPEREEADASAASATGGSSPPLVAAPDPPEHSMAKKASSAFRKMSTPLSGLKKTYSRFMGTPGSKSRKPPHQPSN